MGRQLTSSQLKRGVDAALYQARALVRDAKTLNEARDGATASALTFLAIEEVGKALVIRNAFLSPPDDWAVFWSTLQDHHAKIDHALTFWQFCASFKTADDLNPLVRTPVTARSVDFESIGFPAPKWISRFREESLYVWFDAEAARFRKPEAFPNYAGLQRLATSMTYLADAVFTADISKGATSFSRELLERYVGLVHSEIADLQQLPRDEVERRIMKLRESLEEFVDEGSAE